MAFVVHHNLILNKDDKRKANIHLYEQKVQVFRQIHHEHRTPNYQFPGVLRAHSNTTAMLNDNPNAKRRNRKTAD